MIKEIIIAAAALKDMYWNNLAPGKSNALSNQSNK
jgi:hypothetical protein